MYCPLEIGNAGDTLPRGALNAFTIGNPFLGTNRLELVWGGVLGFLSQIGVPTAAVVSDLCIAFKSVLILYQVIN